MAVPGKARPFVLALLLFLLCSPPALAAEDSAVENMFPSRSPVDGERTYEQFNLDSYYFEATTASPKCSGGLEQPLGMAFVVEMAFLKMVIYISQLVMVLKTDPSPPWSPIRSKNWGAPSSAPSLTACSSS